MKTICYLSLAFLTCLWSLAARCQEPGTLDTLDATVVGSNVRATVAQADGKIIIAGMFSSVHGVARNRIARLNADGTLDLGFNPNASGDVYCVAVQPDGKILFGGGFTTVGGVARHRIARVNPDGTLDTDFDPKANGTVYSIALQADGKIVLGGAFTTLQPNGGLSTPRGYIARVEADGTLDAGFNPKANSDVYSLAVQTDGKVLLSGEFFTLQPNGSVAATTRNHIARVHSDGSLDTEFDPDANLIVYCVTTQADGRILLGGQYTTLQPNGAPSATTRHRIARLNVDGTLDMSFDPKASGTVFSIAVQADAKILLGGAFGFFQPNGAPSTTTRPRLARVHASGLLDAGFYPNPNSIVHSLGVQADGKVLAGGDFTHLQPGGTGPNIPRNYFARLHNDAATQALTAPDNTQILWQRGGTSPEVHDVTLDYSLDAGAAWTTLGPAARLGTTADWILSGLSLPTGVPILLRARATTSGGYQNGSSGRVEATATVVTFAPPGFTPEIGVSGNSLPIASGDLTPDLADHTGFGNVAVTGGALEHTFTISNSSAVNLNLTGAAPGLVVLTGSSAFSVVQQPITPVGPAGNTTFILAFDPGGNGLHSATVTIANDDPDENQYTFAIQGTGAAAGDIAFSAATYSTDQGSTLIDVTLQRTNGTLPFAVTIQTDNGTTSAVPPFGAAAAGTDFVDLTGPATTVSFADGETTKVVPITLIPRSGAAAAQNRRFTATLSAPTAGALLGLVTSATVQILAIDNSSPTLAISAPVAAKVSTAWPFTVKGTAGDSLGIHRVEVSLNGASAVVAQLGTSTTNASVPWSLDIEPVQGWNTLVITAYNLSGNSASVRRRFTFDRRYILSLHRVAPLGIDVSAAGTVGITATPAAAATPLTPAAATANPKTSSILPGTAVKVTATPKSGYVFSHWSGTPAGTGFQGNVITFTMPVDDVPGVIATFVVNPFLPLAGSGNTFHGLVHPSGATPITNATEGYLTGTLTPASGAFSGKILIDGLTQSFAATFYGNGSGLFTISGVKQPAQTFGGKSLTLGFSSGAIQAIVTQGAGTSTGTANRAIYSSANKVPATLLSFKAPASAASLNRGYFTLGLPAKAQDPAIPITTYPQGDGYASITLTDLGLASLTGILADGTAVTGSSALVSGNTCPIFIQLTTPGAAATVKGGSFGGVLTFDPGLDDSDLIATDMLWIRPTVTQQTGTTPAALATQRYTAGWPGGVRVNAIGALYYSGTTVQTALGLGAPHPASGNAQLMLTDGKLTSAIIKTTFNVTGNTVAKIPATDASYTLTLVPTSGIFSGTFVPNWTPLATAKPVFKGIIIQKGLNQGGYGFFLSNAKDDLDPESGGVSLTSP